MAPAAEADPKSPRDVTATAGRSRRRGAEPEVEDAGEDGEAVTFSVPAPSIDQDNDTVYHEGIVSGIPKKLGYAPNPINEGHAVVFAELGMDSPVLPPYRCIVFDDENPTHGSPPSSGRCNENLLPLSG